MVFDPETLDLLARTREVRIETSRTGGATHSTIIWAVVEGDDAFIRSFRGATARWYREARENPHIAIVVGDRRLDATAVAAVDPDSIRRCSDSILAKYGGSQSAVAMTVDDILDTTLRLEPR